MTILKKYTLEVDEPQFPCYRGTWIGEMCRVYKFIDQETAISIEWNDPSMSKIVRHDFQGTDLSSFCVESDSIDLLMGEGRWDILDEKQFNSILSKVQYILSL